MSYSFTVTAPTKEEAKQKISDQMAVVVQNQPDHKLDEVAAVAAGSAFVDLLGDVPDGHEVLVSMHGSVGWSQTEQDGPKTYINAGVGVSAGFKRK